MTTIDKLDISIHSQYARRMNLMEEVNRLGLNQDAMIPPQIRVLDFYPRLPEMDILLGVPIVQTPWAFFRPPPQFSYQRRAPFSFFRVAPSLGSFEDEEENEREFDELECATEDEREEKAVIKNCFGQIKKINQWLGFIIGRVGQFLQG